MTRCYNQQKSGVGRDKKLLAKVFISAIYSPYRGECG